MLTFIRKRIEREVISHTGLILGNIDYEQPQGDPGLYGPEAICWQVHGDFSAMLVGGMSALLLQMLHPAALAGVWEHSNFREDLIGRLRRTGQFVAATTFASTNDAQGIIQHVARIHTQVKGTTAYGQTYSASDPHLLTWVHVAEMRSFLAAHLRFKNRHLSLADQDRYYLETARIASMLGATHIPTSSAAIEDYLTMMRPELCFDERTADVFALLKHPPSSNLFTRLFSRCAMLAALDTLPSWAREFYPATSRFSRLCGKFVVDCVAPILRWAVRDSARYRAYRRIGKQAK
jgi:uncharacterized protein (DUF2236 family)